MGILKYNDTLAIIIIMMMMASLTEDVLYSRTLPSSLLRS